MKRQLKAIFDSKKYLKVDNLSEAPNIGVTYNGKKHTVFILDDWAHIIEKGQSQATIAIFNRLESELDSDLSYYTIYSFNTPELLIDWLNSSLYIPPFTDFKEVLCNSDYLIITNDVIETFELTTQLSTNPFNPIIGVKIQTKNGELLIGKLVSQTSRIYSIQITTDYVQKDIYSFTKFPTDYNINTFDFIFIDVFAFDTVIELLEWQLEEEKNKLLHSIIPSVEPVEPVVIPATDGDNIQEPISPLTLNGAGNSVPTTPEHT